MWICIRIRHSPRSVQSLRIPRLFAYTMPFPGPDLPSPAALRIAPPRPSPAVSPRSPAGKQWNPESRPLPAWSARFPAYICTSMPDNPLLPWSAPGNSPGRLRMLSAPLPCAPANPQASANLLFALPAFARIALPVPPESPNTPCLPAFPLRMRRRLPPCESWQTDLLPATARPALWVRRIAHSSLPDPAAQSSAHTRPRPASIPAASVCPRRKPRCPPCPDNSGIPPCWAQWFRPHMSIQSEAPRARPCPPRLKWSAFPASNIPAPAPAVSASPIAPCSIAGRNPLPSVRRRLSHR